MKISKIIIGALISALIVGGIYAYNTGNTVNSTVSNVVNYCCGYGYHDMNQNAYCCNYRYHAMHHYHGPGNQGHWCQCQCDAQNCIECNNTYYHNNTCPCDNGCPCDANNTIYNDSSMIQYRIKMMEEHIAELKEHGVNTSIMEERLNELKEYCGDE
jgi:hypothetical protein